MYQVGEYTESIIKGDSKELPFIFRTSPSVRKNITGFTLYFQLNTHRASQVPLIEKTVVVHDNPVLGETHVSLSSANTEGLVAGKYFIIVKLINGSDVSTPIIATINVEEGGKFAP